MENLLPLHPARPINLFHRSSYYSAVGHQRKAISSPAVPTLEYYFPYS